MSTWQALRSPSRRLLYKTIDLMKYNHIKVGNRKNQAKSHKVNKQTYENYDLIAKNIRILKLCRNWIILLSRTQFKSAAGNITFLLFLMFLMCKSLNSAVNKCINCCFLHTEWAIKDRPYIILFKMLLHLFIRTKWHTIWISSLFCTYWCQNLMSMSKCY